MTAKTAINRQDLAALASVVVMPVNAPETRDASAAFIEGR